MGQDILAPNVKQCNLSPHRSTKKAQRASVVSSTPAFFAVFLTPSSTCGISSFPYRFGTSPDWRTLLTSSRKHSSLIYRSDDEHDEVRSEWLMCQDCSVSG